MKKRYKVAENVMEISAEGGLDVWQLLQSCYAPFEEVDGEGDPIVRIRIAEGLEEVPAGVSEVYADVPESGGMPTLYVYRDTEGALYFRIIQPGDTKERVLVRLSGDFREAEVHLERKGDAPRPWQAGASLTAAIQLAYHFAAQKEGNLLSHASCIMKDGKGYLFLGRSGTGKSTHSRMWREAFPDAVLLNDDHPILRVSSSGEVWVYGSPWSGKTPCYKNLSAPVGGIVRIRRGDSNRLRRLPLLEAYASVMPSVFNAPFERRLTDQRHLLLEKIAAHTPCYELYCLPDNDAARVCREGMENDQKTRKYED